jgi:hypothetical protein
MRLDKTWRAVLDDSQKPTAGLCRTLGQLVASVERYGLGLEE